MTKEIIYYTCNTHQDDIENACRRQLLKSGLPIISVSLNKEIDFGNKRIVVNGNRGPEMMHKQILLGLKESSANFVFLCESDVLYHPSHFDFEPASKDTFFFNTNVWKIRYPDGLAVWTDDLQQVSGICADRHLALSFYERRIKQIAKEGFNRHYEPGPRYGEKTENWLSEYPNLCIRHDSNLTKSKWSPDDFRNKQYTKGWQVAEEVVGWGSTKFNELIKMNLK